MTKDRQNDIRFHDKTDYDIKLAQDVSDYRDFVEEMTQLANDAIKEINDQNKAANNLKKRFEGILNRQQRTLTRVTNPRYFSYLIYKRFDIDEVIKVQRKDDIHTISDKAFDFSLDTIVNLIEEGEKDALNEIVKQELEKMDKIGLEQTEKEAEIGKHLTRFMEDLKMETTTKMGILSNVQKMN
jgi:NTE family protein